MTAGKSACFVANKNVKAQQELYYRWLCKNAHNFAGMSVSCGAVKYFETKDS